MAMSIARDNCLWQVKPPDLKEKSLNKLVSYAIAGLRTCKLRSSICPCQYKHIEALNLTSEEDYDDHDWTPSGTSRPARSELVKHRSICKELYQILHEDDLLRNLYLTWSNEALITSLKQRGIALPRSRNKSEYALALQRADATRTFAFMNLPQEIRMMVYEAALNSDPADDHANLARSKCSTRPALLQTCRQIREEGIAIFYRINRFVLFFSSQGLENRSTSWLKTYVDAAHFQHLRHITLAISRCCGCMTSLIKIDLSCRDPLNWTDEIIESEWVGRHHVSCKEVYQPLGEIAFMQERAYHNAKPSQNADLLAASTDAAHKAIGRLWEACGRGRKMRPSLSGLLDFIKAVQEIDKSLTRGFR
ncbi:uncharacterized protein M437DRAFT_80410 [Aureobasidium melanogenum CBS 110374]|uniref:2EXR domain-containing protein n=1 Tax=Aureobasidium melanogenum (strain CBS 110374) TaxID=1043003 RepID=A0A074W860_AURM1|nr:uncharacterized protein M437DRAFT_80410 [Aureobasidium melanogenum CBS 110374]KEQ67774.1 hypothetical protein M437DRAFT_80410 [Aureobasidium melanogenum CBS 110374]